MLKQRRTLNSWSLSTVSWHTTSPSITMMPDVTLLVRIGRSVNHRMYMSRRDSLPPSAVLMRRGPAPALRARVVNHVDMRHVALRDPDAPVHSARRVAAANVGCTETARAVATTLCIGTRRTTVDTLAERHAELASARRGAHDAANMANYRRS